VMAETRKSGICDDLAELPAENCRSRMKN